MIRKIFLSLLTVLLSVGYLKAAIGDWTLHTSYHDVTYCEVIGDRVFVLASGALFSYQKDDGEIRTYDKISSLSDVNISHIAYCKDDESLVIIYKNANIDILYENDEVYNITDFKEKTLTNKDINNINIIGNKAYISTGFGIVELDITKKEFSNTYTTGKNTYCAYLFNGYIYTGTNEGVFRGKVSDNLLDNSNWKKINNHKIKSFAELSGELYCLLEESGIYSINTDNNELTLLEKNNGIKFNYLYSNGSQIIACGNNKAVVFNNSKDFTTYKIDSNSKFIRKAGNNIWNCKGYKGLTESAIKEKNIVDVSESIIPASPVRNHCEYMKFSKGRLLIAGGNINYLDTKFYDGTVMEYKPEDNKWINYPEDIIINTTELDYKNICSIEENPNEEGHIFASSFGFGLYEFRNGEFIKHYNHKNSSLESVISSGRVERYVRVPDIKYDNNGNLWVVNTGTKNIIKVLKKDGAWQPLYYKQIEKKPTISKIHFDSRGWMWLVSLQAESGLFCAKLNDTPFDTSDDDTKIWLEKFTNQDGISYTIYQIYGFAEDKEGKIWVGTDAGLFVIDNAKKFFDDGIFTQIKIARNDGTGLADYLMSGVYIQSICIDGANRKWIGTKHNGVYLISADGQETLEHFTTENSPLPSNNVASIAVNDISGEVFIGTENGIASFKGNATEPAESLSEDNIHVYPNPVKADYRGDITVVGLTFDCNVKIVDTAGSLIFEGTSTGGSFTWDGKNSSGERVASGVYYVLTYDENGNKGASTKILFVR